MDMQKGGNSRQIRRAPYSRRAPTSAADRGAPLQHLKLEIFDADPTRTSELIKIAQFSLRQNFTVTFVRSPESDDIAAGTSLPFLRGGL